MDSLSFTAGCAFLCSDSPVTPWTAVFEDEGPAGYLYACDRSRQPRVQEGQGQKRQEVVEESVLDAMLIYNNTFLPDPERERLASVQWSRSGEQCVLYIDGTAQGFIDFVARVSFCRSNFPNYLQEQGEGWRRHSHAWDEAVIEKFEAGLYA
ncbi:MAG: DUF2251 domain-containing protein [Acidobacteriaceae bacterium]